MSLLAILTHQTEARKIDESLLINKSQLTNNCASWRTADKSLLGRTSYHTVKYKVIHPSNQIRLRFMCHGWAGISGVKAKVSVRVNNETRDVTFSGGDLDIKLTAMADSDPIDIEVRPGDSLYVVMKYDGSDGFPKGVKSMPGMNSSTSVGKPNYDMNNSSITGGAVFIYGNTYADAKSFLCMGDSIVEIGWMREAAEQYGVAWSDISEWAQATPTPYPYGRYDEKDTPMFTLALSEYSTNDRLRGTVDDQKQRLVDHWLGSKKIAHRMGQTTMVPYTKGDFSSANQSETDKPWRDELNRWLRAGAPLDPKTLRPVSSGDFIAGVEGHPLVGICDIAKVLELRLDSGETIWDYRNGPLTYDGVHPLAAASELMRPVVREWIAKHI